MNNFELPKFNDSVPRTLQEVIDNDTKTRDKMSLNGLGVTKGESGGVYMCSLVLIYHTYLLYLQPPTGLELNTLARER